MKNIFLPLITAMLFIVSACNNNSSENKNAPTTSNAGAATEANAHAVEDPTIQGLFSQYQKLVSVLALDDDRQAVYAAQGLVKTLYSIDTTGFNAEQKSTYKDISASIEENGTHIAANLGNIAHQREHLVVLGEDFYDLTKSFKIGKPIYKITCPKFNDGKGAFWLSETKEVKNPFYGKEMPDCGKVEETIN